MLSEEAQLYIKQQKESFVPYPEVSYPVPLEDCVRVYQSILNKGYKAENIAFLGESAGDVLSYPY